MSKPIGTRQKNSRLPVDVQPVYISAGYYVNLQDYARKQGVTRQTATTHMRLGIIKGVHVGRRMVLVKVKKLIIN